jgi:hypothetical protein
MGKQKISAKELLADIKSGMNNRDLMRKYELSSKGLESSFKKLVEVGVLEASFLEERLVQPAPTPTAAEMPRGAPVSPAGKATETPDIPEPLAAIAADIQAGLHDAEIMRRHSLSPGGLAQAKKNLAGSGQLPRGAVQPNQPKGTKPCPFCREAIPESAPRCVHCGQWLDMRAARAAGASVPGVLGPEISSTETDLDEDKICPWEERENYGTIRAFIKTTTKCLLTPTRFFAQLAPHNGYVNPILFGVMSTVVSVVLAFLWTKLFFGGA